MRLLKFIVLSALSLALVYALNSSLTLKGNALPPLGKFFAPFTGFWNNIESGDTEELNFNFEELTGEVKVLVDDRGVPHIFAENIPDALFVQGYLTAKDRLWQMEITHRSASGRLSEIFGERALKSDIKNRRIGNKHYAVNRLKTWSELAKGEEGLYLDHYAQGVNSYIESLSPADLPLEYKLFGHEPERFSPLHSTLIVTKMAQRLCGREEDLEKTNLLALLGEDEFNFLFPEHNPQQSPIVADSNQVNTPIASEMEMVRAETYPFEPMEKPNPSNGSNNWAVSGEKTQSGFPILCNDPHLGMSLPSIWHEVQIHTPDMNVYGVTIPGIPGVIIGFNEDIAWGVTNVAHDVTDFYKIKWTDSARTKYDFLGQEKDAEIIFDTILVKGQEAVVEKLIFTELGPVVYQEEDHPEKDLIMRWIVNETPEDFEIGTFLELNKAKNYKDYRKALSHYSTPAQNFVFADNAGDIAITVTGKLPKKEKGQGRFIYPEISEDNLWKGYIPFDSLPHAYNPATNFVGSANQRSTGINYPYYYNGRFDHYRGRILNRKLSQMENIDAEDMMALQNDTESLLAEDALPVLLEYINTDGFNSTEKQMIKLLSEWNGRFDKDLQAPVIFKTWIYNCYDLIWDELDVLAEKNAISKPNMWRSIELMKEMPDNKYFDIKETPVKETAGDIIQMAFEQSFDQLKEELSQADFNWGKHWSADVKHLSNLPAFSHNGLETGGFMFALNAIRGNHGPSWRMIVELGKYPKAYGVYPGGQSGNIGSKAYDSNLEAWTNGEYFELKFLKDAKDNSFGSDYSILNFKKS